MAENQGDGPAKRTCQTSLYNSLPHSAAVEFADRMIIDTRDYNRKYGSQTRNLAAMRTKQLCEQTPQFSYR